MALTASAAARASAVTDDLSAVVASPVMAELVGDDELAAVRGKYMGASLVSGFVVEMVSRWQNDTAIATASARVAAANLAAARAVSQATASLSAQVQSLAPGNVQGNGGVASSAVQVAGVGQVTQIAGDANSASNVSTITTQTRAHPGGDGQQQPGTASGSGQRHHCQCHDRCWRWRLGGHSIGRGQRHAECADRQPDANRAHHRRRAASTQPHQHHAAGAATVKPATDPNQHAGRTSGDGDDATIIHHARAGAPASRPFRFPGER
ncbi:hypothetical protein ACU4GD_07095 [Cupriavidus basilensis]